MKTYVIRVNTIDNLYADYMIEAINMWQAKGKARKAFFTDYPDANENIKLSLDNITTELLNEVLDIIQSENKGAN